MIGLDFFLDRFGVLLSVLFVFIGLMSFIYSLVTIKQKGHRLEYYLMLLLIVGSGVGVALSYNLLLIFIFWEISTFAIWRTVGFYRKEKDIYAANITFFINFAAAAVMLIGLVILYLDNGTFNFFEIKIYNDLASVLILIGILAKSVTIPLHIWLVPAYKSVPSAIGGCLAGIAENIGVILFFRLFTMGNYFAPEFFNVIAWLAIATSIIAGGAALLSNDLRELLAFSTISQVGFILLGFAVGGTYGMMGGVLYILAHALAKSGLFYGVGLIEDVTGKSDLNAIHGMLKISPVLGVSMALLAGSLVGFFPMIGFFAKLGVIIGAVESAGYFGIGAIIAAVFTIVYVVRFYNKLFFGEKTGKIKGISYTGLTVVFVFALVSLLLGIFIYFPVNYLTGNGGF